jgi:hypothetical protein
MGLPRKKAIDFVVTLTAPLIGACVSSGIAGQICLTTTPHAAPSREAALVPPSPGGRRPPTTGMRVLRITRAHSPHTVAKPGPATQYLSPPHDILPGERMKTTYLAILALALPASLVAQQPAGSPPANPITTVFRNRTMGLQRNLAQAFDSIPESKFGYKPTPAQLSIGYIAQHLVSDNYLFCNNFGAMKGTQSATDTTTADSVKATWPKDSLVAKLKASLTFCESAFAQLNDANLADQLTVTLGGQPRTITRAGMVLGHALDMADHYSQLANYMRLNNILPPTALPRPKPGGE